MNRPIVKITAALAAGLMALLTSCAGTDGGGVTDGAPIVRPADKTEGKTRRAAILAFTKKSRGKKVGKGDCWAFANEAFKSTGAKRPGGALRVWGRKLDLKKETPLPGDILECDRTRFSDGSYTNSQHTAIIVDSYGSLRVRVSEQNHSGRNKVTERDLALGGIKRGTIAVYRPQ